MFNITIERNIQELDELNILLQNAIERANTASSPEEYADSMEEVNIIKEEIRDTNNNIITNNVKWN